MPIYSSNQQQLAEQISPETTTRAHWKDWRWQLRHSIRSIATVERLLGLRFDATEKKALAATLEKFPLAITPYYLSLIDASDYRNDPVFMQSFPSPRELEIERRDLSDRNNFV